VFWGIRLVLQGIFDVKPHLTTWWLKLGYLILSLLFAAFTVIYGWAVWVALASAPFSCLVRPYLLARSG